MNKLEQARTQIDAIDREMAKLYEARLDAVKDVIAYKIENDLPILDSGREQVGNPNPNLSEIYEVEKISCAGKVLYEPQWGLRGLSEDETAVATLMIKTALYNRDEAPAPYSAEDAIADAYAAILLKKVIKTEKCIRSDMKWIKE